MSDELPPHLDPFAIMAEYGFEKYVGAACEVLPDDWGTRYTHTSKGIAQGLTYYVAYNQYSQYTVADRYGVSQSSVAKPFWTLKEDLGDPRGEGDV